MSLVLWPEEPWVFVILLDLNVALAVEHKLIGPVSEATGWSDVVFVARRQQLKKHEGVRVDTVALLLRDCRRRRLAFDGVAA